MGWESDRVCLTVLLSDSLRLACWSKDNSDVYSSCKIDALTHEAIIQGGGKYVHASLNICSEASCRTGWGKRVLNDL